MSFCRLIYRKLRLFLVAELPELGLPDCRDYRALVRSERFFAPDDFKAAASDRPN